MRREEVRPQVERQVAPSRAETPGAGADQPVDQRSLADQRVARRSVVAPRVERLPA